MEMSKELAQLMALDKSGSHHQVVLEPEVSVHQPIINEKRIKHQEFQKIETSARLDQLRQQLIGKIEEALIHLDFTNQEKLSKATLRDISAIILNLKKSTEVDRFAPTDNLAGARLIIYAPEVNNITQYNEVIVEEL